MSVLGAVSLVTFSVVAAASCRKTLPVPALATNRDGRKAGGLSQASCVQNDVPIPAVEIESPYGLRMSNLMMRYGAR
jgi:hypothetical protein